MLVALARSEPIARSIHGTEMTYHPALLALSLLAACTGPPRSPRTGPHEYATPPPSGPPGMNERGHGPLAYETLPGEFTARSERRAQSE